MTSQRVRDDDDVEPHGDYLIRRVGKRWRVYGDGSHYSQTSGGVMARGKVLRWLNDKPVSFASLEAARGWIDGGCRLVDGKGNEINL